MALVMFVIWPEEGIITAAFFVCDKTDVVDGIFPLTSFRLAFYSSVEVGALAFMKFPRRPRG